MQAYDVFNANETSKYLRCDFVEWKIKFTARSIYSGGRHFQVHFLGL